MSRSIVVTDTSKETMNRLCSQFMSNILVEDDKKAAKQNIVFLALHPPVIPDAMKVSKVA